jgi:cell division control protein 6
LYEAGRIAEKEEASIINEEHVANAAQQAEINRFTQLVSGTTPHSKHILRTLAIRTADNPGQQSFSPSEIYEAYTKL